MKTATFIQPRHTYAPEKGLGHIYMPTAILMATSRVLQAGGNVGFQDENIQPVTISSDTKIVGMHTVGPSMMPSTLDLQARITTEMPEMKFLQGGQIIDSLDRKSVACLPTPGKNFRRLFGGNAINGNDTSTLANSLGLNPKDIPATETTSLIPAYDLIDDTSMALYLSHPFSLYVSQGCKFACNFCSAKRSHSNTIEGRVEKITEVYRDIPVIEKDVTYLIQRAKRLNIKSLTMYMSNLDLAQTPEKIGAFAEMMRNVRRQNTDVAVTLTGLSTIAEYKNLVENHPGILQALHEAGLRNIGFGIEGMGKDYWRTLRKGQNKRDDCYNMIADGVERGFTPEILLTPGHEKDTEETLQTTKEYAEHMKEVYDSHVVIRPYCAKVWTTGSDGWHGEKYADRVEAVMSEPRLFQGLEFNAEQTWFTASNPALLRQVNDVYRRLVDLSEGSAPDLRAITPGMTEEEIATIREHNQGKYDH